MTTQIFIKPYDIHVLREIRRASKEKNITDIHKLKERLAKQDIKVNFDVKYGKVQNVSFQKGDFKISSIKGHERLFTDRVIKSVEVNKNSLTNEQNKEKQQGQGINRFDQVRAMREEKTALERRDMYNTKGFGR